VLTVFIGCSDETSVNPVEATFSSIYSDIISIRCATSGCHDGSHPRLNMQTKENAYTELLNKTSSVGGLKYIEPGLPNSSYFYLKIIPDGTGREKSRMPLDGGTNGYLSSAQIDAIKEWIEDDAPNN